MKKAIIEGMCCAGCAKAVRAALANIYGLSQVKVSLEGGYATFEGFVSREVIASAIEAAGYRLVDLVKV